VRRMLRTIGRSHMDRFFDVQDALNGVSPSTEFGPLRRAMLSELESQVPLTVRELAVSGQDLLALGRPPGKWVGETLDALLEHVLDDPSANVREPLLTVARQMIAP
jgi:tRNA nucleotidyltransferase (CCA-adding enzyme)